MVHTYKINGMTCTGCEYAVKSYLSKLPDVESVELSKDTGVATIRMSKHIPLIDLKNALAVNKKYSISEDTNQSAVDSGKSLAEKTNWLTTYKPLLVLFSIILIISFIPAYTTGVVQPMLWMRYFMAGFFLCFSYFKLINLKGFADSYSMYDIIARRFKAWGYIYPFIEFALGISYVLNFAPLNTNITTAVIMGISSVGVIESVVNKKKIQCACLGAVFNLPMSTITIIEDLLMVIMAVGMIWMK